MTDPSTDRRGLYRSTYAVFLFACLLLGALNWVGREAPTSYTDTPQSLPPSSLKRGWPWTAAISPRSGFLATTSLSTPYENRRRWLTYWTPGKVDKVHWLALFGNLGVVLVISLGIAGAWQLRRRHRATLFSLHLNDVLLLTAGLAVAMAGVKSMYRDDRAIARIVESNGTANLSVSSDGDVLHRWLWETLHVPHDRRPKRVAFLHVSGTYEAYHLTYDKTMAPPQVPHNLESIDDIVRQVGNFRDIQLVSFNSFYFTPTAFRSWHGLHLKYLSLHGPYSDRHMVELGNGVQIRGAMLTSDRVSDTGVAALASTGVKQLIISSCPEVSGSTLSSLQSVDTLEIGNCPITDEGLSGLSKLPKLRHLHLWNVRKVGDWSPLSDMTSLETLEIGANRESEIVQHLPMHLRELVINNKTYSGTELEAFKSRHRQ